MTDLELLVDLHKNNNRQGPGSETETLKAINLLANKDQENLKIVDIGCGSGAQTLTLAKHLKGNITAVDLFPNFLKKLELKAIEEGVLNKIETRAMSMEELNFRESEFDIIWSEGAIYILGFKRGVKEWHRYLKPGGFLAVSELSWITESRPKELEDYWLANYPEIDTVTNKVGILKANGYTNVKSFILPEYCWVENYYKPLQNGFTTFLKRNNNSKEARLIVETEKEEIKFYTKYKRFYSYGFYIAQK